jgi:hypothetical protein
MCAGSKHLLIYDCLTVSRHFENYFIGTDLVRSGLLHGNCEPIYLRAFSFSQKTRMRSGTNFKQMWFFMASLNGYMNLVGFLFSYTKEMRNGARLHRTMWFFPRRHWIRGEGGQILSAPPQTVLAQLKHVLLLLLILRSSHLIFEKLVSF